MNAKDILDYGGMGVAVFTVVSSLAFARWVLGRAFEMMTRANEAFSVMANVVVPLVQEDTKEGDNDV